MKTVIRFFVIVFLIGIIVLSYVIFGSKGTGERAGTLVKLSNKGILFHTNEGELYSGAESNSSSSGVINKVWYFTVKNDPELIKQMDDALLSGTRVMLHYNQKFITLPWVGDTPYIVDDIQISK
jgi:hypothetical protein